MLSFILSLQSTLIIRDFFLSVYSPTRKPSVDVINITSPFGASPLLGTRLSSDHSFSVRTLTHHHVVGFSPGRPRYAFPRNLQIHYLSFSDTNLVFRYRQISYLVSS